MSDDPKSDDPGAAPPESEPIDAEFAEVRDTRQSGGVGFGALVFSIIFAALVGGALGGSAAWWLDRRAPDAAPAQTVDLGPLEARIAKLEEDQSALERRLANAPAPSTEDSQARNQLADMESRLTTLSEEVEEVRSGQNGERFDPAPLRQRLDTLLDRIAALESRPSGQDERAGEALNRADTANRNAQQAQSQLQSLQTRLTALEQSAGSDRKAQTAFQYAALREAALRGAPFQLELAALENETDARALDVLRPLAAAGVATEAELLETLPVSEVRAARQGEASLAERARGAFSGLGTLRRSDEEASGDPLDVARASLKAGDLEAAIQAMESLTGAPADAASDWLDDARARRQAISALDDLRDQLMEAAP
ncbi:MAG: hypothetical protein H2040_04055 [Euryhalocaulis sp.]|uniref:COG4223 family protein n=1 Tax=Euryhalocaulis sp. TaxID=2744307 RepID=UPI0018372CF8|nr:mitofilin family membrane protein [Euryhalocaulis sp.]MBA4801013.1 hypothetical protein [Euryhalocaulis sp.]